ncbi:uncharacterized protein RAG0_11981 [Rhynchosporium agropyri]|uniref:Uncharacterized protein n=1 Tax=Rhynchosporium agropyri TaxID=914238 RepID=A0A1E1L6W7_9HELO|nr:uncharacterized protein RAG0_11981 [Rhynchosporium agropyri]
MTTSIGDYGFPVRRHTSAKLVLAVVPRRPRQNFLDSVRAPACPGELVKNGSRLGVSKEIVRRVRKQVYAERGEDVRGRRGAGWGSF